MLSRRVGLVPSKKIRSCAFFFIYFFTCCTTSLRIYNKTLVCFSSFNFLFLFATGSQLSKYSTYVHGSDHNRSTPVATRSCRAAELPSYPTRYEASRPNRKSPRSLDKGSTYQKEIHKYLYPTPTLFREWKDINLLSHLHFKQPAFSVHVVHFF